MDTKVETIKHSNQKTGSNKSKNGSKNGLKNNLQNKFNTPRKINDLLNDEIEASVVDSPIKTPESKHNYDYGNNESDLNHRFSNSQSKESLNDNVSESGSFVVAEDDDNLSDAGSVVLNDEELNISHNKNASSSSDPTKGIDREALIDEHKNKFGSGKDTFSRKSFVRLANPRHQRLNSVQFSLFDAPLQQQIQQLQQEQHSQQASEQSNSSISSTSSSARKLRGSLGAIFNQNSDSLIVQNLGSNSSLVSIDNKPVELSRKSSKKSNRKSSKETSMDSLSKNNHKNKLLFSIPPLSKSASILRKAQSDLLLSGKSSFSETKLNPNFRRKVSFMDKAEMISYCSQYPRSDFFRDLSSVDSSLDSLVQNNNDNEPLSGEESGEELDDEYLYKDDGEESGDEISIDEDWAVQKKDAPQTGIIKVNGDHLEKTLPSLVDHDEQHHLRMIMLYGVHSLSKGNYTPGTSTIDLSSVNYSYNDYDDYENDDEDIISDQTSGEDLNSNLDDAKNDSDSELDTESDEHVLDTVSINLSPIFQLPNESESSPIDNRPYFYFDANGNTNAVESDASSACSFIDLTVKYEAPEEIEVKKLENTTDNDSVQLKVIPIEKDSIEVELQEKQPEVIKIELDSNELIADKVASIDENSFKELKSIETIEHQFEKEATESVKEHKSIIEDTPTKNSTLSFKQIRDKFTSAAVHAISLTKQHISSLSGSFSSLNENESKPVVNSKTAKNEEQEKLIHATPAGTRNTANEIGAGTVANRRAMFNFIKTESIANTPAKWKSTLTRSPTKARKRPSISNASNGSSRRNSNAESNDANLGRRNSNASLANGRRNSNAGNNNGRRNSNAGGNHSRRSSNTGVNNSIVEERTSVGSFGSTSSSSNNNNEEPILEQINEKEKKNEFKYQRQESIKSQTFISLNNNKSIKGGKHSKSR